MDINNELSFLGQKARQIGIVLNKDQLGQFTAYHQELIKWNAKTNLISEKSTKEVVSRHFLDSLTALQFIEKRDARIIDVGCGAGFPGIPLKIASPKLQLYLLETNRKKVSFLKHIIRRLNLSAAFVVHDRVENLLHISEWQGFFDFVISRAAFKLPEMIPWGAFLLALGGKIIALKSSSIAEEFSQAEAVAPRYGFHQLLQYDVHNEPVNITRKIIIGEKEK